ncbi:MAG TPA: hypothetical protein VF720_04220 [Candidatus Eisenbacteria bacterium]
MRRLRITTIMLFLSAGCLWAQESGATFTVYFDPAQIATVGEGTTTDTVRCQGYEFVYTRDKLFTGGGSVPIGRPVRVAWPTGVEAQYVTAGPNPEKARITVRRVDGDVFDVVSFTARLLANAGAGRAIEIVPMLNGEEPFNDPFYFDVSGYYGQEFSYDRTPNYLGTTAPLVDFDTYHIGLTLDYALVALTLEDHLPVSGVGDSPVSEAGRIHMTPNPARSPVQIRLEVAGEIMAGIPVEIHAVTGALVRTLRLDGIGRAAWDLRDERGQPVGAGVYFARATTLRGIMRTERLIVLR